MLTVVDGEVLAEGGTLTRVDRRGLLDDAAIQARALAARSAV